MRPERLLWIALLPLAFGAGELFGDIVIMKDGAVVDCKIKDIKYPNPKNTGQFILVIETDERGTLREVPWTDIKTEGGTAAIYRQKPLWVRRGEYEKEYERKLAAVKDSWQAQVELGKWCRAHLLPDRALEHYKAAYLFRVTGMKDTVDEHLKVARWCEKELALEELADKEYLEALEIKREEMKDDSAGVHAAVGKWCESVDLMEEAVKEYETALQKDAKNSAASGALKRIKNSVDFLTRQFTLDLWKDKRAWKISVAVQEPASKDFLEGWKKRIEGLSAYIFTITEGQFFIAEVEIEDNVQEGTIIVEKGKMDWRGLDNKQGVGTLGYCRSGGGGYEVHVPGIAAVSVLAHEVFHGAFGLPDEYLSQPMCDCVMKSAPNPQKICDKQGHLATAAQGDCWTRVTNRFKTAAHPNPKWQAGEGKKGGAATSKAPTPASTQPQDYAEGNRVSGELDYNGLKLPAPPPTKVVIIDNN